MELYYYMIVYHLMYMTKQFQGVHINGMVMYGRLLLKQDVERILTHIHVLRIRELELFLKDPIEIY